MGAYSEHYYGISITEYYDEIERIMSEALRPSDADKKWRFDLGNYLSKQNLGESGYDGGGYGQITFIGQPVRSGPRGYNVSDAMDAEVRATIANLPPELSAAIVAVLGSIPEPSFEVEEGWG